MNALPRAVLGLACLAAAGLPGPALPGVFPTGRALLLSDIHFDPLDDPSLLSKLIAAPPNRWSAILQTSTQASLSTYGSDTNYPLFQQALAGATGEGPYDYVLYTGDALRHDFAAAFAQAGGTPSQFQAFALNTQLYVIDQLQRRFRVPVFLALGNDDSDCGDYQLAAASPYLAATARALQVLAKSPAARKSFARGGYYALPHPTMPGEQIIVLNSVLWSSSYASCKASSQDPGTVELGWLSARLAAARAGGQGVTLAMHVPAGMDAHASSQEGDCAGVPFLKPRYSVPLAALLQQYADIVRVVFAGHTHMDDFRLPAVDTSTVPLKVIPAISPLFGNNPAFATFSYDRRAAAPRDVAVYYLPLGSPSHRWTNEYRFTSAYGVPTFDRQGVATTIAAIRAGGAALKTYGAYYASSTPSPFTGASSLYYVCAQSSFSQASYRTCVCGN